MNNLSLWALSAVSAFSAQSAAFAQFKVQSAPHEAHRALQPATSSTAQIVQALVGVTQSNGILPCVGDGSTACYGIPSGAVALQPNMIIAPGTMPSWYVVFQTGAWSGNLSASFQLNEAGTVVQSATASATAQPNSTVLVAVPEAALNNGYNGPATLDVGTVAIPRGGGGKVTLKSSAVVQVGSTGSEISVGLAGPSRYYSATVPSPPCTGADAVDCYGVPPAAAVVWPENVTAPVNGDWYAVFQSGNWKGALERVTFTLTEQGETVMTYGAGNGNVILENSILAVGVGEPFVVPNNGYVGPAVLTITALASQAKTGLRTNLKQSVPIQVLPAAP